MDIQLGNVAIQLLTADPQIEKGWQTLFAGWEMDQPADPLITLSLALTTNLPPPPPIPIHFQHPLTSMVVYQQNEGWQLRFPGRAIIHIPFGPTGHSVYLNGQVTPSAAQASPLEDITFTALAPWLRRWRWYLVHAFAVAKNGQAWLFVGPSGSGKTTTGLRFALAGGQLLGNDLVLLENRPEGVTAIPTPGLVRIRPGTLSLLPQLQQSIDHQLSDGNAILNRTALSPLVDTRPVPVTRIFFPQVRPEGNTQMEPLSQGVTLARLAEESLDRWDTTTLTGHLDCLQKLSSQAEGTRLNLGRDAGTILNQLRFG